MKSLSLTPLSDNQATRTSMSLAERILEHLKAHKDESKRDMSGLVAAFGETERPGQIRLLLDQLVRDGRVERYGNGRRHCWRVVEQPRSTLFMDWYNKSPWSGAGKDAGTLAEAAWNAGVIAASETFWRHEITKKRISIEDSQVLVGDIKWLSRNACELDDEQPQHPE